MFRLFTCLLALLMLAHASAGPLATTVCIMSCMATCTPLTLGVGTGGCAAYCAATCVPSILLP